MSETAPPKSARSRPALSATEPGAILDGKYRVESVIGKGGMAVVVAARHLTLAHRVAIKLLRLDGASSGPHTRRFLREARAAAALQSDFATRVLDFGTLQTGEPYLVMELLEGVDLGRLLRERGPRPVADVASYVVQACDAIAEAHAAGIIHRDIKPSNLFLTTRRDGTSIVKLMDFGISKMEDNTPDDRLTATQDSLGTTHYMSPEQLLQPRDVDSRTDIWALGVVVFRLLTGELPFDAETTTAVHLRIVSDPTPRLRALCPDAPVEVEQLVDACLAKSPNDRPKRVESVARTLLPFADASTQQRFAHLLNANIHPIVPAAPAAKVVDDGTRSAWDRDTADLRSRKRGRRWRGPALAAAVVLVGACAGGVVWKLRAGGLDTSHAIASASPKAAEASSSASTAISVPALGAASMPPEPSAAQDATSPVNGDATRPATSASVRAATTRSAAPPANPRSVSTPVAAAKPADSPTAITPAPSVVAPAPVKDPYGERR